MSTNTSKSFRDKWEQNADLTFAQVLDPKSEFQRWILQRNGFADLSAFTAYLSKFTRILDAGCGNGRVTALLRQCARPDSLIVGVDRSSADVARTNLRDLSNVTVETSDLLAANLGRLGLFDFIYCQEVLHHTSDPQRAFRNLCELLMPDGEIAIYVYKKKAPVREFTDDFVRDKIAKLEYAEAMTVCRDIAEIGRVLSNVSGSVTVPTLNILGIDAGEYSIQRFVYHFFMKCFWNNEISAEANAVVNYDWYHPEEASRHTLDEVRAWYEGAGVRITHESVDPYGITVRGIKTDGVSEP